METFKTILGDIIKKKKMTVTEFSSKTGVNKGTLSGVVNGARKISENSLAKILDSGLLDDVEKEELCDCFFAEEYSLNSLKNQNSLLFL